MIGEDVVAAESADIDVLRLCHLKVAKSWLRLP